MAVTQYVGPKIVPHGFTDWNATTAYDGLYCAYYGYQWYIACNGPVPVGVSPVDREYWAPYSLNSGDIQNITAKVNSLFPQAYLSQGTDLNTITEPGNYMLGDISSYVNSINIKTDGALSVIKKNPTQIIQSIKSMRNGFPVEYERVQNGDPSVWSEWKMISAASYNPETRLAAGTDLNTLTVAATYMLFIPNGNYQHLPTGLIWDKLEPQVATLEVLPALDKANGGFLVTQRMTLSNTMPVIYQRTINSYSDTPTWTDWYRIDGDFNYYSAIVVDDANTFFAKDITVSCKAGPNTPDNGNSGEIYNLSWIGPYQIASAYYSQNLYIRRYLNGIWGSWIGFGIGFSVSGLPQLSYNSQFYIEPNKKVTFHLNNPCFVVAQGANSLATTYIGIAINTLLTPLNPSYQDEINTFASNGTNLYYINKRSWRSLITLIGSNAENITIEDAD